jgi:transposase
MFFLKAITAMAHTLARLVYRMLKFGHHYVDQGIEYYEAKYRQQQLRWTAKQAAALNMHLVRLPELEVEFLKSCSSIA